ncbi:unnamed protein product, partial [Haemonchus placei]|uniref:Glycine N-acyltransferase-like protein n=1 Tax=Haemonchus placei TaxID=6290 RepID=A0A0N4W3N4_HAEPC
IAIELQQHFSKDALGKALERLSTNPRHLLFYHPVKFELRRTFPFTKLHLYSHQTNDTTYWLINSCSFFRDTPIFTYDGVYNENDFLRAFDAFQNRHDLFGKSYPIIVAEDKITNAIFSQMSSMDHDIIKHNYACHLFYMTDEQQKLVMQERLQVPEGYTIGTEKIRRLPSVCVRKDGHMVGFYGIEALGWLNHQFVFQEHRHKGLGTLLELAHAQNFCKLVETHNLSTFEATKRSKFWTLVQEDGKDVIIDYLDIFK